MAVEWFFKLDGVQVGPMTPDDLKRHAAAGRIQADTLVRKGDNSNWYAADKVTGLLPGIHVRAEKSQSNEERHAPISNATSGVISNALQMTTTQSPQANNKSTFLIVAIGLFALAMFAYVATKYEMSNTPHPAIPQRNGQFALQEVNVLEIDAHPVVQLPEAREQSLYEEAKQLLLKKLHSVGGTPGVNVKKGIELLKQYLSLPMIEHQEDAKLLLEHAEIAISDDMAMKFLLMLDDLDRGKLSGKDEELYGKKTDFVVAIIKLEQISHGFSRRMEDESILNSIENKEEPAIILRSKSSALGEWRNSIALAFYETLEKNAERAINLKNDEQQQAAIKRAATREQNPTLTAKIFDLIEKPHSFDGKCIYLDGCKLDGDYLKVGDNDYRLKVTDNRGKLHASGLIRKNELVFSTSAKVISDIQGFTKSGQDYPVKLYCDMYLTDVGSPFARVYKIEFLSVLGRSAYTASE